jgi:hypothetical protein
MNRAVMTVVIVIIVAIIAFFVGRNTSIEKPPQKDFPGAEKHEITKAEADKYIQNYQKNPQIPKIRGGAFQRAILDKILAQPDCDGIRIYYAQTEDSSATLVLVGITASGREMTKGLYSDKLVPCPPWCD